MSKQLHSGGFENMEQIQFRSVVTDGKEIMYQLERKAVKNLNLRIRKDGNVFVSAASNIPVSDIDEFVSGKATYILNAIKKFNEIAQFKPEPKQYVSGETFYIQGRSLRLQVLEAKKEAISSDGIYIFLSVKDTDNTDRKHRIVSRFLDKQCREVFEEIMDEVYPIFGKYGVKKPVLRIRDMETRWGSCLAQKGIITLNKRLLEAPRNCIEYVIMHEFCHFIHPNHSKSFYAFLTMLMPDWKCRKQLLDQSATYWL